MGLTLYIHIPWCVRKCPYCDFNSHQQKFELPEKEYVQRLLNDLEHDITTFQISDLKIQSIFFGGGTPSLFSADAIQQILTGVNQHLTFDKDCEITLEANPGTFEAEKFSGFKQAGVNRLSIGIQSFNDKHLKKLGRIHDKTEAKQAIETAFSSGFDNINLDLMYALPEQSIDEALLDLQNAFEFPIAHLSHYQLTLEPNTLFHKFPPKLPDDDTVWDMQLACQEIIKENNFVQYEISAYAQSASLRSRHNLNYWRFGDYLGIGAGAHGKMTLDDGQIIRTSKPRHPRQYIENALDPSFQSVLYIDPKSRIFEFFLNRLRLNESFSEKNFESSTGLEFSQVMPQIMRAVSNNWLQLQAGEYAVTALGFQYLNNLQSLFLPEQ